MLEKIERIEPLSNNNNSKNKQLKFRDEKDKFFFYIKPYVIFHLDEETKENFLLNVDRSSAKMKFRSLVIFSDYAIFEMMYNMKFVNIYSFFTKLSKVKFRYLLCHSLVSVSSSISRSGELRTILISEFSLIL